MSFDNPLFLFFLIPVALYIPSAVSRYRKNRGNAAVFASAAPSGERESMFRELKFRMVFSDVFFLFSMCFLIIALSGPRWGIRVIADYRRGVDVILAFDVSRSMDVTDCPPLPGDRNRAPSPGQSSRLERGIAIARELASSLGDLRFGIALGKGRGVLAVPLTYDSGMTGAFLGSLDSLSLTGRGTNLASLLDAASGGFQDFIPSSRAVILFSDGESHSGSFQAALEKARKAGVSVSAAGLGSVEGGLVPSGNNGGPPEAFLLGPDGEPVVSVRQDAPLRDAAEKTGGVYVDGDLSGAGAVLARYLNSLQAESRLSGHRREANPRWRFFVIAAIACLGCARAMGFSRRKRGRTYTEGPSGRPGARGGGTQGKALPVLLCSVLFLTASCARTQGKLLVMEGNFFSSRGFFTEAISSYLKALEYGESAPYAEYGLGAVYFGLEEGAAALERYKAAGEKLAASGPEEHLELKYRIQYNMGIIYFEQGGYSEAADAFREALKIDGSRIEAKRNLELSLLTIDRMNSPQADSQGGTGEGREGSGPGGNPVLFEYLRQMEQEQWRSREWSGEDGYSGPDY